MQTQMAFDKFEDPYFEIAKSLATRATKAIKLPRF